MSTEYCDHCERELDEGEVLTEYDSEVLCPECAGRQERLRTYAPTPMNFVPLHEEVER